jgi:hypothetical protein
MMKRFIGCVWAVLGVFGCARTTELAPRVIPVFGSDTSERISGETEIRPEPRDQRVLNLMGRRNVEGVFKLCVDNNGVPGYVEALQSTRLPGYDAKLRASMLTWRYRPAQVDARFEGYCTRISFHYTHYRSTRSRFYDRIFLPSGHVGLFTGQVLFAPGDTRVTIDRPRPSAVPISTLGGRVPTEGAHLMLDIAPLDSPYELELWVSPVDLAMVTRHPVILVADPRQTDREVGATVAGFRLERGTPVEILARTKNRMKVQFRGEGLTVSGWVPASSIAFSYIAEATDYPIESQGYAELQAGTRLLEGPGGPPLDGTQAPLSPGERLRIIQRQGSYALVSIYRSSWWALGWVPEAALVAPEDLRVRNQARRRSVPPAPITIEGTSVGTLELEVNTPLLHQPGGAKIGRTLRRHKATVQEVKSGYSRISIPTDFGVLQVWVRDTQ